MAAVILIGTIALMGVAAWKFLSAEWGWSWRTRRSGPSNNWQNEGYMANQDGMSWNEIDGAIGTSAPPRRVGK